MREFILDYSENCPVQMVSHKIRWLLIPPFNVDISLNASKQTYLKLTSWRQLCSSTFALVLDGQMLGQVQTLGDALDVLQPLFDLLLVRCQVRGDEEQGCAKHWKPHSDRSLRAERRARSHAEAVIFRNWNHANVSLWWQWFFHKLKTSKLFHKWLKNWSKLWNFCRWYNCFLSCKNKKKNYAIWMLMTIWALLKTPRCTEPLPNYWYVCTVPEQNQSRSRRR